MKKKVLLCIVFSILSCAIFAQKVKVGDVYYQLSGGEATVVHSGLTGGSNTNAQDYTNEKYIIPETFEYDGLTYTVTEVAAKAFWWSSLKYIVLPQTIRKMSQGDSDYNMYSYDRPGSFYNSGLIRIVIPKQCTSIGTHCFIKAAYLRTIIYTSPTPPSGWTATTNTYVPDVNVYKSPSVSINGASIKEIITWENSDYVYDGNPIELPSYTNNIEGEGYNVEFDLSNVVLSNTIGAHKVNIPATFTSEDQTFSIDIPYNYNVTGAPLTITVENAQREYGDANPEFTYKIEGFVNGEDESYLQSLPTISTTAKQNSSVGTYPIVASNAQSDYYTFKYNSGMLTITKATLSAKVNDTSKVYGNSNPSFTISYEGLKNNETNPSWEQSPTYSTTAEYNSSVGTYPITASGKPRNYELTEIQAGVLTITPAPLTINVNNATKVYYEENPKFTYSCNGLRYWDDISVFTQEPSIFTSANKTSNAGNYDIDIEGAIADNYSISYKKGILTINKKALSVSVGNYERDFNTENPEFTLDYIGFVDNEDIGVIDIKPYAYTSAKMDSNVGTYTINITGGEDNNYSFYYNSGKLTINRAEQDLIWNQDLTNLAVGEQVKLLAEATSGLEITYSLDQNEICEVYSTGKSVYLDCKSEGEIQIRASQDGNGNYYATPRTSKKIVVSSSSTEKPLLTIKQANLGSISTKVERGSVYEFTITPEDEWLIHSVSFNDNDYTGKLNNTNTFTTPQITNNSTIVIVYSQEPSGISHNEMSSTKIIGIQNGIKINDAVLGTEAYIYSIDGSLVKSQEIKSSSEEIKLANNQIYIIKIGKFTSKVRL